jgi:hypothetical protein
MAAQTDNQYYHLILADIAMAAAIRTCDHEYVRDADDKDYVPASIRDGWLARTSNPSLRQRVLALASAGLASLQKLEAEPLARAAETYGVPLAPGQAGLIAEHFANKRDAVLTYTR